MRYFYYFNKIIRKASGHSKFPGFSDDIVEEDLLSVLTDEGNASDIASAVPISNGRGTVITLPISAESVYANRIFVGIVSNKSVTPSGNYDTGKHNRSISSNVSLVQ